MCVSLPVYRCLAEEISFIMACCANIAQLSCSTALKLYWTTTGPVQDNNTVLCDAIVVGVRVPCVHWVALVTGSTMCHARPIMQHCHRVPI
jgi:hypothetical protein